MTTAQHALDSSNLFAPTALTTGGSNVRFHVETDIRVDYWMHYSDIDSPYCIDAPEAMAAGSTLATYLVGVRPRRFYRQHLAA